jgi:hypothetical protein
VDLDRIFKNPEPTPAPGQWRMGEPFSVSYLPGDYDYVHAGKIAKVQFRRETSPPPPSHPPDGENFKKIKKFSGKSEEFEGKTEENAVQEDETMPEDRGNLEAELVSEDMEPRPGFRIVSPIQPGKKLARIAAREGCPQGVSPVDFLLDLVAHEPPEIVNGGAYVAWQEMRLRAAGMLLPYMAPRIAPVAMEESASGHESALDELE